MECSNHPTLVKIGHAGSLAHRDAGQQRSLWGLGNDSAEAGLKSVVRAADREGPNEREAECPMRDVGCSERRKYLRIPMRQVLSIARNAAEPRSATGLDLSVAGIRFEIVGCEIDLAEVLTVSFQGHDDRIIRALGRVVWCTEIAPILQEVGLEFLEMPPDCAEWLRESVEAGTRA